MRLILARVIAIGVLALASCAHQSDKSDARADGDDVFPFPGLKTVDGGPQPPFHDAIAIQRNAWLLFGSGDVNTAFSIARADEARLALDCVPGKGPPVAKSSWPFHGRGDPPEWNPPKHDALGVASCVSEPQPHRVVIVRQELDDDVVRYFVVVSGGK